MEHTAVTSQILKVQIIISPQIITEVTHSAEIIQCVLGHDTQPEGPDFCVYIAQGRRSNGWSSVRPCCSHITVRCKQPYLDNYLPTIEHYCV